MSLSERLIRQLTMSCEYVNGTMIDKACHIHSYDKDTKIFIEGDGVKVSQWSKGDWSKSDVRTDISMKKCENIDIGQGKITIYNDITRITMTY